MAFISSATSGSQMTMQGVTTATTLLTTVTAHASTHTKGAYAQIAASTPHEAQGFVLFFWHDTTAGLRDFLIDIAIGAASSEVDILSNYMFSGRDLVFLRVYIPLYIPSGVRLSARVQCETSSYAGQIAVGLMSNNAIGFPSFRRATTYGAATADSGGTSVDPGGSADTKGAYSEITSSTTYRHEALQMVFGYGANTAPATARYMADVAIGAAASETIIVPDYFETTSSSNPGHAALTYPFMASVPASTRLAIRTACHITDASDRLKDFQIIGYD